MAKIFLVALWQQRRKQHVRPVPESNAIWAAMLSFEAEGISFALSLKFCHQRAGLERQGMQDTQTGSRQSWQEETSAAQRASQRASEHERRSTTAVRKSARTEPRKCGGTGRQLASGALSSPCRDSNSKARP